MCVFAENKRFFFLPCKIFQNPLHAEIHLTLYIAAVAVTAVIVDPLVMHRPVRVKPAEFLRHRINDFSAVRLISAGPDQNRRMIFVSLIAGIDT